MKPRFLRGFFYFCFCFMMRTKRMQRLQDFFSKTWVRWTAYLAFVSLWFVAYQPWGGFDDPDAFYHSTIASLMLKQGVIHDFHWLDLTSFAHPFVDQHFLFHVALMPFVAAFGALPGGQVAAVVFGIVFCLVFAWCLKKLKTPAPFFWALVLATMPAMTARLSYGKASPLAVSFFVLGVTALMIGAPALAFFVMAIYVLTHAGWPLLLLTQGALLVGHLLYLWTIESVPVLETIKDKTWLKELQVFVATCLGAVIGFVLHPYRAELLGFLKVQIVQIGIATPYDRVVMGNEWYGPSPLLLALWFLPFVLALAVFAFGLLVARRPANKIAMRQVIMLAVPTAFIIALNLKSSRFVEYAAPMVALTVAPLFHLIDVRKTWREFVKSVQGPVAIVMVSVISFILIAQRIVFLQESYEYKKPFNQFAGAMQAIRREVKPGERLFHSDWSHMPVLWSQNQDIRYVAGLDPTFLLAQNPELSDRYTKLTLGEATSTAYDVIVNETHSSAVFVDRGRGTAFEEALKFDTRFERVYEDADSAVYRIKRP